jgi:hypothetical protein
VETDCDWFLKLWADSFDGSPSQPPHSVYQPITSPIHQTGKTSWALRQWEIVLERLKGWKADAQNIAFEIADFMQRRKAIHKYDMQVLDEPQRAASSRTWHAEDQNILAEDLMASNRYIKPALFPTPLNAMIDNRIFDIATSQVVIPRLAHAEIYYLDRAQLDRKSTKVRTPKLGSLTFDKPSAVLWHAYCKMFDDYYDQRNARHIERVRALQKESNKIVAPLESDDLVALIMQDPQKFIGKSGNISPSKVQVEFKVPYNRAQTAATDATSQLQHKTETETAEAQS